jgi:Zn-dependent protease
MSSLALGYMPSQYPGLSQGTYWIIGFAATAILFSSVLFHELSHAFVALRKGIRISSIMLFFFGGIAQMAEEPRKPNDEVKIAIAGPLFSFAVGGILLFLWYFAESGNLSIELSAIFRYGGYINLLVGAFNMIPAFPLDGGRVLRAHFWNRSSNILKATVSAAKISMIFANTLIFGSFFVLFLTRDATGIWFFFIGLLLRSMAESSLQHEVLRHKLEGVYAGQLAVRTMVVDANTTLEGFSELYGDVGKKRFAVLDNSVLTGIFESEDLKKVPRREWHLVTVRDLVKHPDNYALVEYDTPTSEVLVKMSEKGTSEVFVLSEHRYVGRISYHDLVRFVQLRL